MRGNEEQIGIIAACDLDNFSSWWAENISSRLGSCDTITGSFDVVQHAFFAIWCTKDVYAEPYEDEHRFVNNPDKIEKTVNKCPQKFKLKNLFNVLMNGPLFGKSLVAKNKSDIEKTSGSYGIDTEHMKFQSIIEDILIERTHFFTLLKIFRITRTLKTNEKMTNRVNYFKRGKELFETFCTQVDEFSRMFPACPAHQEYIDLLSAHCWLNA